MLIYEIVLGYSSGHYVDNRHFHFDNRYFRRTGGRDAFVPGNVFLMDGTRGFGTYQCPLHRFKPL